MLFRPQSDTIYEMIFRMGIVRGNIMEEKDLVFGKTYKCVICDKTFKNPTFKQGKIRMDHSDLDLRIVYKDGIEPLKYDIIMCPHCGYAALERYYERVSAHQIKDIKSQICDSFTPQSEHIGILDYEEAVKRYKFAFITSMVKNSKPSEIAFLCLKLGWMYRSYGESLERDAANYEEMVKSCNDNEEQYLHKAYDCFLKARGSEQPPIAGMDDMTLDCLLAALGTRFGSREEVVRLLSGILTSRVANKRMKDKAREIKELISDNENDDNTEEIQS